MANVIVVGMQWGDEGKGKIVDLLCPAFDAVARYQGGHNAGHTVKFGDQHFSLSLIPSGILHPGVQCVLGNGMVIDPAAFFAELGRLRELGVGAEGRLFVSNRAHALLPLHAELDQARERGMGEGKIGTTGRGIGPAYEIKTSRFGVRIGDLFAPELEELLRAQAFRVESELVALGGKALGHPGPLADLCRSWREGLRPFVRDTEHLLNGWVTEGKSLMFEGAQGTLLDIDHGSYPFVTSSNSTAGGACTGTGVPPTKIDGVLGVLKAYTTRVGGGPFPTELREETGEFLRQRGHEFGTVTGRPRRCGWLDLVAARYATAINGTSVLALTKLDVLDTQETIRICTAYRYQGSLLEEYPAELHILAKCEPVYEDVRGWQKETVGILEYQALPERARDYVRRIEDDLGVSADLVSTGPRREETIVREEGLLEGLTSGRFSAVLAQLPKR